MDALLGSCLILEMTLSLIQGYSTLLEYGFPFPSDRALRRYMQDLKVRMMARAQLLQIQLNMVTLLKAKTRPRTSMKGEPGSSPVKKENSTSKQKSFLLARPATKSVTEQVGRKNLKITPPSINLDVALITGRTAHSVSVHPDDERRRPPRGPSLRNRRGQIGRTGGGGDGRRCRRRRQNGSGQRVARFNTNSTRSGDKISKLVNRTGRFNTNSNRTGDKTTKLVTLCLKEHKMEI